MCNAFGVSSPPAHYAPSVLKQAPDKVLHGSGILLRTANRPESALLNPQPWPSGGAVSVN